MDLRRQTSILVFITFLVNSILVSLADLGFYTRNINLGGLVCALGDNTSLSCMLVGTSTFQAVFNFDDRFYNLTPPHVSIHASEGSFNVMLNNTVLFPNAFAFFMVAEGIEIDIDLIKTSTNTVITTSCNSKGSLSKLSSNILKSSAISKDVDNYFKHVSRWRPFVKTTLRIVVPEQDLQPGHFTCSSLDEGDQTETIRIFKQKAASFGASPFVAVRELTIKTDDAGQGFIVPCRTNYLLKTAPDLLWRIHERDNFSMLTADEMEIFKWDPRVGFKFNTSVQMWEMKTLACRLGPDEKIFLPTPSRFMNLYVVTVVENKIGCELSQRYTTNHQLFGSKLSLIEKRHHECRTDVECDLYWELGILELGDNNRKVNEMNSTERQVEDFGMFSCFFEHIYDNNRVPETSYKKFFEGYDSRIYLLPGSYPNSSVIRITQFLGPFYKSNLELNAKFTCTVILFKALNGANVDFILRFKDETEIVFQQNLALKPHEPSMVAQFDTMLYPNLTQVICQALLMDGKFVSAESRLQVIDASAPLIDNVKTNESTFKVGDVVGNHTLVCPITGAPPPKYQWIFDKKNTKLVAGTNTRNLQFQQIHEDLAGSYTCWASNEHGNNSFEFKVSVDPPDVFSTLSRTTIAWTGFGTIVGLIGLGATTLFALKYVRAQRQMRNLTPAEALEFLNGIPTSAEHSHGQPDDGSELALRWPFTKRIEPNVLIVSRDSILGKGQYGIVYRGFLHAEAVAVKAFKRAVTYDEFMAALVEVKLMDFVGEHPNIVRFIGADVTNIEKRDILIVMELSPIGSLEKYLRALKASAAPGYVNTTSVGATDDERLMLRKLFGFCEQIAFAMEHLESKHVIHGDLATRNVLVFDHDVVKVTDFGYSRQLYENNMYKPKKNRALPWRSASIELLRQMEFSTESDIWAFGVTVWEIFTFGNVPFASVSHSDQFVKSLEEGLRLEKPAGLCESEYAFLMECWNVEKSGRPRFSVLKSFFSTEEF